VRLGPVELVCPRDRSALSEDGRCRQGHGYRIVDGVPILLVEEDEPTHASCERVESLPPPTGDAIDPFVQEVIGATCGGLYRPLVGRLREYPIPELRLPPGERRLFLEVGCNWGRWCVAAARRGYVPVGIDPSLKGIQAARRVAGQLGVEAHYVVGDARYLPFADATFDVAFSYSVFQHFSRAVAVAALDEIGRVLRPGGTSLVQVANVWGVRSLLNQARERRFREPRTLFDVRYWGPRELRDELELRVGPTQLKTDGFLTLNPQPANLDLLPPRYRSIVRVSEGLRLLSHRIPPLTYAADSLYALSRRG
jgi:SAM-dependent methyltransferase